MEYVDLAIIGCGVRGLAMGKTYRQVHKERTVLIFDSANTVGGCWAEERIYPGLRTNNVLGTYEFTDFDMTPEIAGVEYGNHIPATGVHRYLCDAARFYDLEDCLRLGTRIQAVELRRDDTWEICYSSIASSPTTGKVVAKKLVVATGAASDPKMPKWPGQDDFQGLLIHSAQLKANYEELTRIEGEAVVVGGNKSALDAAYLLAKAGRQVHLTMRISGGGPSYAWRPMKAFGRTVILAVLAMSRIYTLLDPWPFKYSWVRNFLHRWRLGLAITNAFWSKLTASYAAAMGTNSTVNTLVPRYSSYWMGTSLSTMNYPTDWLELVRQKRIIVHHAEVQSLSEDTVTLTDGAIAGVGAVVCCTGWKSKPPLNFGPPEIENSVGFPSKMTATEEAKVLQIREEIYRQRPFLRNPARAGGISAVQNNPISQLYRFLIPPAERFLAARNLAMFCADNPLPYVTTSETQALWITAFFDGKLLPSFDYDKIQEETRLWAEYQRIRHPRNAGGYGGMVGEFVFDSLLYQDRLMEDLGLDPRRKKTLYEEWFVPYNKRDYAGIVEEWKAKETRRKKTADSS